MKGDSKGGIFVTATDTGVGKTFVCGLLLRILTHLGVDATYFKPVATGCVPTERGLEAEDVRFVEMVSRTKLREERHCPMKFLKPLAPLAASRLEQREVELDLMRAALDSLREEHSFVVVEGVGGILVPFTENYTLLDFMEEARFPALVVARPGLGTINHTLLTIGAIRARGIPVLGFVTNGQRNSQDEAVLTSPGIIEGFSHVPFLGHIPHHDTGAQGIDPFIQEHLRFLKRFISSLVE